MSAQIADRVDAPVASGAEALRPRVVDVRGAAVIADRHPETVREAARRGELHGTQREGVNPRTHKPFRSPRWKFRPACVDAWVDGEPCEHQRAAFNPPVSLSDRRRG